MWHGLLIADMISGANSVTQFLISQPGDPIRGMLYLYATVAPYGYKFTREKLQELLIYSLHRPPSGKDGREGGKDRM